VYTLPEPDALYIHVPFCVRKCHYCDFVSYPYCEADASLYLENLRREMELLAEELKQQLWHTVFIGGGTPTCLSTPELLAIIALVNEHFNLTSQLEFTIEANPGTIDTAKLYALRQAGVNRLSLGAQSFKGSNLKMLGRIHTPEQTSLGIRHAREAGFDNLNLDLIFELPGQTLEEWKLDLEQALAFEPEHISAYSLQLEEHTLLKRQVDNGILQICAEEQGLAMYQYAAAILTTAGFEHYEISNFAKPGYKCKHNLVYWHNEAFLGLGPAAHSRRAMNRWANESSLASYTAKLQAGILPRVWQEQITLANDIFETVFLALRMTKGLDLEYFKKRFARSPEQVYSGVAESLVTQGLLECGDDHWRLTPRGRELANWVMREFAP